MSEKSPIYTLLVGKPDNYDVERLVAYALYKSHKREWCEQFVAQKHREPTAEEKLEFANAAGTTGQLERYQKDAADALIEYANKIVEEERENIVVEAITDRIEISSKKVEQESENIHNTVRRQNSIGILIWTGFISSLLTTALLVLLTIGTWLFGVDFVDGLESLKNATGGKEASTPQSPAASK
ncbi:hypothetical protein [Leisingera sp. NJS204]|uniref:hypothetical protein n=1 Tax=Leisingera sp. NJS204 TaxID=2508307 RepID=UPI00101257FB|nr:hypothetical protein [Leisingera sp. NJS204]QAX29008.1 hypothetical protein ETW24_06330 [Leisingera sp. NJS204]